jgi:glutathione S-transferase
VRRTNVANGAPQGRNSLAVRRYALVDRQLAGRKYLFGDQFTVADAYLFVVTRWAGFTKVDLSGYINLQAFQQRVAARPAVQAAMREEGLIPAEKAA